MNNGRGERYQTPVIAGSPEEMHLGAALRGPDLEVELLDGRWALWVTDVSQTPNMPLGVAWR